MKLLLGIDIGTQSIRCGLFDFEGNSVALAAKSQSMSTPKPGWATQSPLTWWQAVVENIQKVISTAKAKPEDIVAVGCCGLMHSPVPIASNGHILTEEVQLYCDKRAAELAEEISNQANISRLFFLAANMPTSNWFGIKIKWIKKHEPAIYQNTYKFLTAKDFINFMLTGETCIDHSEASGSFLMDQELETWSNELIEAVGIDKEKLPEIHKASSIIGHVRKEVADSVGLKAGTPVVCGGGDMLCSLLASGLTGEGKVVDLTGTGSVISFFGNRPILDKRIMNLRHVMPGWVPFGCIDSAGGAFRWLRDVLAKKETEIARGLGRDEYDYLCELAQKTNYGADGILFFPYLMGERTLGSPFSRAVFLGMNQGTTMGHLVRAVLEGIAFEHKRTIEIVENSGVKVEVVYHTGGGAKGDLWSQIKADIYGKPVCTLYNTEGGVLGAALLAGVGIGIYENESAAGNKVARIKKEFQPDESKAERYNYLYALYKNVHDLLQDSFVRLAAMP